MRIPIPFDKEVIDVEETFEHVDYYIAKVNTAYSYLEEKNNQAAMEKLREINADLEKEYNYYTLLRVHKPADKLNDTLYWSYKTAIHKALAKQNKKNAYSALNSNLYDIQDYLNYYKIDLQ